MSSQTNEYVMEARGLSKRYGQVIAMEKADFNLYSNEILAVIGDNGAGKSTLIKALAGALIPDEGQILINNEQVHFQTPIDARKYGIETVYQDLAVSPALNIVENVFLGREIRRSGILGSLFRMLDKKKMLADATEYMKDLKFRIQSMEQAVETLSGGQRQGVAVARSAAFARNVIILDEPTAALGVDYYAIDRADLVRALIYPVPDLDLPFLGVHLTRRIDTGEGQLLSGRKITKCQRSCQS